MWFVVGTIFGIALLALLVWIRSKDIKVSWYEYLIGSIGLLLLMFTIQNWVGAVREGESASIVWYLLIFGLPSLILMAIASNLAWRRNRAKT